MFTRKSSLYHFPEADTDPGRHFRMSLHTFKDESAAKSAQWASLAEDRGMASFLLDTPRSNPRFHELQRKLRLPD